MIRCAVDAREYSRPNRSAGISRFLTNIVAPLGAGTEFEFNLLTLAPDSVPSKLQNLPGVRLDALPQSCRYGLDQWMLPRAARAGGAQFFFSPFHKAPFFPGLPLVVTVHDIGFLRLRTLTAGHRLLARLRLRLTLSRASKVICVSKFTERDVQDLFPGAADKTVVLYSDLGADWYRQLTDHHPRPAPAVSPAAFGHYFLYCGNFKPHKNVDQLVQGFHAAANKLPEHNLVLIGGDADNTPRLRRLIRRLDLERRVYICRDIDDFSLSRFYQAADWFVTASGYEGFGYPAVEAMIAECPVICHPVTSLIEVAGGAALPIHSPTPGGIAATLIRAAQMNVAERQEFIAAGHRQARLFTPGQTAQAFARLCRTLVSDPTI
ncbi:MAG: glycosyltransferase family 1 protein [bacterium]